MNTQALYFILRNIGAGIGHDGHFSGMVQQAVLTLHIIRFLLLDPAKLLASEENFRRIVDVDMNAHTLLAPGNNQ